MLEWRFLRELALLDLLGEGRLVDLGDRSRVSQKSGPSDPLLDQFIEGAEVGRPVVLKIAFRLYWIILKGCGLDQALLVRQSQPLLLLEDVLIVKSHSFSFKV